ncbi:MAG: flippase-like domain-containing protein [Chitinivibrionales bacterium]|nr:flippase-like domain-containing protein [Chitinivibrionales bacterium]
MKLSRILQLTLGFGIAAFFIWWFFKDIDFAKLWVEMKEVSLAAIISSCVLANVSLWFRAQRWKIILPDTQAGSKKGMFAITEIGFMANSILPFRLGEAVRAWMLWRRKGYRPMISVGSLVVERIFDTIGFMTMFVVPVFFMKSISHYRIYGWIFIAVISGVVGSATLYRYFPNSMKRLATKLSALIPKFARNKVTLLANELVSNLDWLFDARKISAFVALSIPIIFCYVAMLIIVVGNWAKFNILGGMFTVAFVAFGAALPGAPGYIGTIHKAIQHSLVLQDFSEEFAGAAAIIFHAASTYSVVLVGLFFYFTSRISFKEMSKAKQQLHEKQ